MKILILLLSFFMASSTLAQTGDLDQFLKLFKTELAKYPVGAIEDHYQEGYFKTTTASDYFDRGIEIGISSLFSQCIELNDKDAKLAIAQFFAKHKAVKAARNKLEQKMDDFDYVKPFIKLRVYSNELKPAYANTSIVRNINEACFSTLVLDLTDAVGNVQPKYLSVWKKTEDELFEWAKSNTISKLSEKFKMSNKANSGEVFHLLTNDTNFFISSCITSLTDYNTPNGTYGTLIAVPTHSAVIALPLTEKNKVNQFCQTLTGLIGYMSQDNNEPPTVTSIMWWYNNKLYVLKQKGEQFILPDLLQKLITP